MDGAQYGRPRLHYKLYLTALFAYYPQAFFVHQLSACELMADKLIHKSKTAIGSTVAPTSARDLPTARVLSKQLSREL